jgi:hypothetical protein
LEGGKRDKDAVIAPQMPTGRAIGQAIFDNQTHGHVDDPMGVMASWRGQISEVNVKVLAALRAVMRGIAHQQINRAMAIQIA